ncbi:HAD family hydrolase [Demequina litorisediminis]|uniref:HAD family hydrolase n=1 Tax=Demequina litorisediminis TaxID=1849022 RepID=UPI0032AF0CF1
MIRGASAYHIARGLKRHGFFRKRDVLHFAWEQAKYTMLGESKQQIDDVRDEALGIIKGWSVAEMIAIGEEVYDEILALRIFPGTRALIDSHLEQGHEVWFVTATPQEVGSIIASRLGVTGALGTVAENVDGFYTGKARGLDAPRSGEGRCHPGPGRGARARPVRERRLWRLDPRRADARRRRSPVCHQPRCEACAASRRNAAGPPRTSAAGEATAGAASCAPPVPGRCGRPWPWDAARARRAGPRSGCPGATPRWSPTIGRTRL